VLTVAAKVWITFANVKLLTVADPIVAGFIQAPDAGGGGWQKSPSRFGWMFGFAWFAV
jgi:hypothetical protein